MSAECEYHLAASMFHEELLVCACCSESNLRQDLLERLVKQSRRFFESIACLENAKDFLQLVKFSMTLNSWSM